MIENLPKSSAISKKNLFDFSVLNFAPKAEIVSNQTVLPEVAISRQLGYFRDTLGVKKSPWRVGYFVAILENDLIL